MSTSPTRKCYGLSNQSPSNQEAVYVIDLSPGHAPWQSGPTTPVRPVTKVNNMAGILRLVDIPSDFSARYLPYTPTLRQKQRAAAFVKGSFFKSLTICKHEKETDTIQLFSRVYRSQRKSENPHKTSITIKQKKISDAYCSCKAGIGGRCAHVLALISMVENWKIAGYKDVPSEPASTSLPQQWDKPRGPKISPEPVSTMVMSCPQTINRKRKPVMPFFNDNRKIQVTTKDLFHLRKLYTSPVSYLVDSESTTKDTPLGSPLSYHVPLFNTNNEIRPRAFLLDKCGNLNFPRSPAVNLPDGIAEDGWAEIQITQHEAEDIEKSTRVDRNEWKLKRKNRVTASNFGHIMKRKKEYNDQFIKNNFDKKEFYSDPTSYGQANEIIAKQMYIKQTGNHIHNVGFIINPQFPFLGATPDAIVCDHGESGIVEIKCPYSARDMSLSEACDIRPDFFLIKSNDMLTLRRDHIHWFQVQGQLLVTGAPFLDFVTFTRKDFLVERIYPEHETMNKLLLKLTPFYIKYFKPYFDKKNT